jgi:hypothetical protein
LPERSHITSYLASVSDAFAEEDTEAIRCAATSFALDRALLSEQIQQISAPEPWFEPSDLL